MEDPPPANNKRLKTRTCGLREQQRWFILTGSPEITNILMGSLLSNQQESFFKPKYKLF